MSEIAVVLKISKVGDREAMTSLNLLDKKGQEVVENIAGRTGKSLGAVASAYTRASAEGQKYFAEVAAGYQKVAAEEAKAAASAERSANALEGRQAHAVASAARGLEMVGRTGQLTGRSLDAVLGQVSMLALGFGPTGALVSAIGIATAAVVEMFMRTSREAKKLADETLKDFARIAHGDIASQGQELSTLYSGDADTPINPNDPLSYARNQGIAKLRTEKARLEAQVRAGTSRSIVGGPGGISSVNILTDAAKKAADQLSAVKKGLEALEPLYDSIRTNALPRAAARGVASDQPGFATDALNDANKAGKKWETEAERAAKAYAAALHKLNVANAKTDAEMEVEATHLKQRAAGERAGGIAGSLTSMQAVLKRNFESAELENAVDPAIKKFSDHVQRQIGDVFGNALSNGFEAAFSSLSLSAGIEALTASILSGIGGMMEALGTQMIVFGSWVAKFLAHVATFDAVGQIEAGIGLVAAGAALRAVAGSFGHSGSGGGSYGTGASSSSAPQIIDRGIITPGSYSTRDAGSIQARPMTNVNLTVIGPDDPNAQRGVDEIIRRINQRGSLAGGR